MALPLVNVKEAGRWKDTATLVRCYQQSDAAAVLAVLAAPQKLGNRVPDGTRGQKWQRRRTTEVTQRLAVAPPRLELGLS